jgi:nuclear transport factor 2 (NTF2) superfamily protein
MLHYSRDFAPVCTFRIRVEQAQIRDEMLLVLSGQHDRKAQYRLHRDQAAASAWAFSQHVVIDHFALGSLEY